MAASTQAPPATDPRPGPSADTRLYFVLGTMALLVTLNTLASVYALGPSSVVFNTALILTLFAVFIARTRDRVLLGWGVFGLAAGFAELPADAFLVHTETLVYPAGHAMIWDSPAYMPFAWMMVLLQIGGLATWLVSRYSVPVAAVLTALVAGINIPLYEHLAKDAGWWFYQATPMIFSAPYYVIVAEFLLALPLAFFSRGVTGGSLWKAAILGLAEGAVMLVACWIAFTLVGPCEGALIQLPCP